MMYFRRKGVRLHIGVLLILFLGLSVSCQQQSGQTKRYDPNKVAFRAEYNEALDHIIYPSLVLGLGHYSGDTENPKHALFSVSVTAPINNAVMRIVVDSSCLNYVTILQETLPQKGQTYTFYPKLKWKYEDLYHIRQQGSVDLTFTCFVNDEEVDTKTLHLNYRSVNECLLSIRTQGRTFDARWLFAAYVNEDHPYIDEILSSLLQQGIVSRFSGYQSGSVTAEDQVFALWYYALDRGITYSSISCTSNPSEKANVQHIRFFDEVYNTRQANCVDACVFFASLMRKVGLKPVILVEPCHAYLGYYTDRNRKKMALLETTITSWVNFPAMDKYYNEHHRLSDSQEKQIARYLDETQLNRFHEGKMNYADMKLAVAHTLFDRASEYDKDNYKANKAFFADTSKISYQQLDIEQLRKVVQPIN